MNQYVGGIEKRAAAILAALHVRAHTQVRPYIVGQSYGSFASA